MEREGKRYRVRDIERSRGAKKGRKRARKRARKRKKECVRKK